MPNSYFQFKRFKIDQDQCGMKVTTDACFFGAVIPVWHQMQVLDIGTGTGLLSLMLAQKGATSIDAIEIDQQAYEQARNNFEASPWKEHIQVWHSALQEYRTNKTFQLVICNPPFFKGSQKGTKSNKNKALHADFLSMEALVKHAAALLDASGEFWVMYPEKEMKQFMTIAQAHGLFPGTEFVLRNEPDSPVFRKIQCFSKYTNTQPNTIEVAIRNKDKSYTRGFSSWLKDFYLHL